MIPVHILSPGVPGPDQKTEQVGEQGKRASSEENHSLFTFCIHRSKHKLLVIWCNLANNEFPQQHQHQWLSNLPSTQGPCASFPAESAEDYGEIPCMLVIYVLHSIWFSSWMCKLHTIGAFYQVTSHLQCMLSVWSYWRTNKYWIKMYQVLCGVGVWSWSHNMKSIHGVKLGVAVLIDSWSACQLISGLQYAT